MPAHSFSAPVRALIVREVATGVLCAAPAICFAALSMSSSASRKTGQFLGK